MGEINARMISNIFNLCALLFAACFGVVGMGYAQIEGFSNRFDEALKLSEENEQQLAFGVWQSLASENPENGNVNYRAGLAQLSSGKNKTAALPYFQRALGSGIASNFDRFSSREEKAPIELLYYLGYAYHLNYKLQEAEDSYTEFLEKAPRRHHMRPRAQLGIEQARNAAELMKEPVDYPIENLGAVINTEFPEFCPVVSIDENALFFTSSRIRPDSSNIGRRDRITGDYFNDIYVSYKDRKGNWQEPELLELNEIDHTATISVSADGQTLYIYRDDNGVGNIYESRIVGENWTDPVKMGGGINTENWENHIAVSVDGEKAYFVSDRPKGLGGRDIYRVRKLPTGEWSKAQNLGPNINTPYDEDAVFISPDGNTLYFSSEGHNSMGGFDIFYSEYEEENDAWGPPVNIGYPINTVDDDVFFVTSADQRRAYFSSIREGGFGEKDIYIVRLPGERDIRLALLLGKILTSDNKEIPTDLSINVINQQTKESSVHRPRLRDGSFVAILPPCHDYLIEYAMSGLVLATDTFSIDCESAYQEIYKDLLLNPLKIEPDGSARILRGEEAELLVTASGGDMQPAKFKRYFGYNENIVDLEEEIFIQFMNQTKKIVEQKGEAKISITGSASTVPTRTYGSNEKLAKLRTDNAVQRIKKYAAEMDIDVSKLVFESLNSEVGGPAYRGDFRSGKENYKQYQYVDITAR